MKRKQLYIPWWESTMGLGVQIKREPHGRHFAYSVKVDERCREMYKQHEAEQREYEASHVHK